MGQYDFVTIAEGAQMVISVAQERLVKTETVKAFPEAEYPEVVGGLR